MELSSFLVLVLVLAVLVLIRWIRKPSGRSLPPGPLALPLIGNLPMIDKRAPFKSFMQWSKTYGPVMTVYLGPQRMVVLVGYDTVKEALVDQADDFAPRGPIPFLNRVVKGYGLIVSNGERWRQLRRFTLTTLRDFGMGRKRMERWIQEESKHLLKSFEETRSKPVDPVFFMSRAVSNVICSLVFGQRFDYDDKSFLHLLQIISRLVRFVSSPWGQEKDNLDTEFHKNNLMATVLNLFVAGTETTSTTLRYALMLLIKHPHIQGQMQREIDRVIGRNRVPTMEDKKSLPFTDAVIHEVQRFLDIVPLNIPHYAMKDITFRGYVIPKDTVIIPMLHSVLRDEVQWETPWTFNPEHFLDANGNFKKNPAFIPFSAGKRSCVGESLARMELFLFIVSLLQRFSFSSPQGPDGIDPSPELSSFANMPRFYKLIASPR
ncbi:cytochrome P450 2A10-like isoform X2 [Pimephales promelas]|uniref:cytochrome P450 2A10-like isoform X2 n=1 Tax=Pimephales promelas TaxID=90988 RepID=UPI0019556F20|nr:cytochrome P450 2A10-like isoform X2 [Pimephales promelas]